MKKLLIIRHAKAEQGNSYNDFERPLKPRGIEDAETMAQNLLNKHIVPQMILCSPALRTLSTADVFAQHLAVTDVRTEKAIYEASDTTLLKVINSLPDEFDFVALIGHNPGLEQILGYLSGKYKGMSTTATALLVFETDTWAAVSNGLGTLTFFAEP